MADFDISTLARSQVSALNPYIGSEFSATLCNVSLGISIIQDIHFENESMNESTCLGVDGLCESLRAALNWEAQQPARKNKIDIDKAERTIQSRDDLSFTRRDDEGRIKNWDVPHDKEANWHDGLKVGESLFQEVRQLALFDEVEAYNAIRFAMNSIGWSPMGWGIETGFSDALARVAILGMRALQAGAVEFDENAHTS